MQFEKYDFDESLFNNIFNKKKRDADKSVKKHNEYLSNLGME